MKYETYKEHFQTESLPVPNRSDLKAAGDLDRQMRQGLR